MTQDAASPPAAPAIKPFAMECLLLRMPLPVQPAGHRRGRMKPMRLCLCLLALIALPLSAAEKTETIEGKLIVRDDAPPALETADRKKIALDGDQATRKVLHDARLNGF